MAFAVSVYMLNVVRAVRRRKYELRQNDKVRSPE